MGKNARARVMEMFTWEVAARNTLRVYTEAIEKSHGYVVEDPAPES
jgi:hypothetical protein